MAEEMNGFEKAASALGKVQKMVRSGDEVLGRIEKLEDKLGEVQAAFKKSEAEQQQAAENLVGAIVSIKASSSQLAKLKAEIDQSAKEVHVGTVREVTRLSTLIESETKSLKNTVLSRLSTIETGAAESATSLQKELGNQVGELEVQIHRLATNFTRGLVASWLIIAILGGLFAYDIL